MLGDVIVKNGEHVHITRAKRIHGLKAVVVQLTARTCATSLFSCSPLRQASGRAGRRLKIVPIDYRNGQIAKNGFGDVRRKKRMPQVARGQLPMTEVMGLLPNRS